MNKLSATAINQTDSHWLEGFISLGINLIRQTGRSNARPERDAAIKRDDGNVILKCRLRVPVVGRELGNGDVFRVDAVGRRRDVVLADSNVRRG